MIDKHTELLKSFLEGILIEDIILHALCLCNLLLKSLVPTISIGGATGN